MMAPMPSRQPTLPKPIPSMGGGNTSGMMRDHHSPTPRYNQQPVQSSQGQGPSRSRIRSNSPHRRPYQGSQPYHHHRTPTPPPPQDYSYQYTDNKRDPDVIRRGTSHPPRGVVGRGESIRSRGRGRANPRARGGGTSVRGPRGSSTFSAPRGRTNVAERLGPKVNVADRLGGLGGPRGRGGPPKHHDANNTDYSTHEISNQEPQRPSTSFDSDGQFKNRTKRYAHMMLCDAKIDMI